MFTIYWEKRLLNSMAVLQSYDTNLNWEFSLSFACVIKAVLLIHYQMADCALFRLHGQGQTQTTNQIVSLVIKIKGFPATV